MLLKHWRRVRLLQRLMILIVVFLIVPVLGTGYFLFSKSLQLAQNESREILEKVMYQLNENIEYRITGYQNIVMQLALDPRITTTLTQEYDSLEDVVMSLQQLNAVTDRIRTYFPMRKVQFYKTNPSLLADGGVVMNMEQADHTAWFQPMEVADKHFYWHFNWEGTEPQPALHLSKWLVDYLTNERFGIVHVEVTNQALFSQLFNPLAFKNGNVMITDQNGRSLIRYKNQPSGFNMSDLPAYRQVFEADKGSFSAKLEGEQSMVMFETNRLGWKIITVVKQEELWQQLRLVRSAAIAVSVLFVVLTLTVLMGFGTRVTGRLNALIRQMRKVRDGDLGLSTIVHGQDELADVEEEFNSMTIRLNHSLKESAEARVAVEMEKLRLLQAQINPHFLYNTLALVKSMAMDVKSTEISGTIDALAKFFRLALNRGGDKLSMRDELDHVRAYLEIHNWRYPGRLETVWEIEDEVLDCRIIKITLQPIVENALQHAFKHSGGRGCILIRARLATDYLDIEITDDGVGMAPDTLLTLQAEMRVRDRRVRQAGDDGGFGLYNVHERLRRHYGESFRMDMISSPGSGTTIRLKIPQSF
ncbi:cache domain-containing sensor histidine kinase [Paenibacillus daejeonensis]|uniref:cache domain-containing sensor histidine kinase n=1 Tax=Paenibacillus daejeonensis TaxID=135193 RepID=UPI00036684ED|nr:sensor histidine kinase [Paenibacillus daejeonensis]